MLSLTRKAGERVMIGDNIIVQVLEIGDGKVRLGFTAPRNIDVHREEVFDEVKRRREEKKSD